MLLSIVIPSYNHARFVVSTIRAAAKINIQNKEVIVIDDGSSDASVSVIREYIASKGAAHNIRLITRENRGAMQPKNAVFVDAEQILQLLSLGFVLYVRERLGA